MLTENDPKADRAYGPHGLKDLTDRRQVGVKSSCQCFRLKNCVILCAWKKYTDYTFTCSEAVVQGNPDFFQPGH